MNAVAHTQAFTNTTSTADVTSIDNGAGTELFVTGLAAQTTEESDTTFASMLDGDKTEMFCCMI